MEGRKCAPGDVSSTSDAPAAQGATEHRHNTGGQRCPVLQGGQAPFRLMGLIFKRSMKFPRICSEICQGRKGEVKCKWGDPKGFMSVKI